MKLKGFEIPRFALQQAALYTLIVFVLTILQTTLFAYIGLFGMVPDLVIAFVVALSFMQGEKTGAYIGIIGGVFVNALGGINIGVGLVLLPLLYMLCGYASGILSARVLSGNYFSWLSFMCAAYFLRSFVSLISLVTVSERFSVIEAFSSVLIPEYFCSLIFCSLVYPLALLCTKTCKR